MALDGITIAAITAELKRTIEGGRISKIAQPESDELLLTIGTLKCGSQRLLLSAQASLPLVYITQNNKPSPITAPSFCMLLRKHISNGRIISVSQPGLERIINIDVEHLNEMGDLCTKRLIIELMGKHSNIIFTDDKNMIIDSIKHIPASVSSVREVLPGRTYFIPETVEKLNPLTLDYDSFKNVMSNSNMSISKAIYSNYTGISPFFSYEICARASLDGDASTATLSISDTTAHNSIEYISSTVNDNAHNASSGISDNARDASSAINCNTHDIPGLSALYSSFKNVVDDISSCNFKPCIIYENNIPREYSALPLTTFTPECTKSFDSVSSLLEDYYAEKEVVTRIRQKSIDLRKIVQTVLERDVRKYDLQKKQLSDTEKKDKYRLYGELLNTYGYNIAPNSKSAKVLNYYTNEEIDIPLDENKTAIENAQKYYEKYNKLKRTKEALDSLITEVEREIEHLESIQNSIDIALTEDDLTAIKEEMINAGYIRRKSSDKKPKLKSKPFHYVTKEGFHIFVGKNNIQNEEITFGLANGNDWWFHAKKIPGSHVIVKTEGRELPDSVFEDAARLAAFYSKAKGQSKIEVDYVRRKEVKHPNGSKPGFVVYYTNYSMLIDSDISGLTLLKE